MVIGKVIAVELANDAQKNLIIWVCYSKDGIEFEFHQGVKLLEKEGHKVWPLYCRYENFIGKTPSQITSWVQKNIEYQAGNIIQHVIVKDQMNTDSLAELLKLIGNEYSTDKVLLPVEVAGTKVDDVELKDDLTCKLVSKVVS